MINLFNIFKPKPDTEVKSVVFDRLYSYQKDAVQTTMLNTKGIVCMPTSVGKCLAKGTKIFNFILKDVMSYINVVMRRNNKNIVLSLKNKDKNINFELNNNLYKHFKTLNPMQQEIIKQTMQLKYLELNSNN